MRSCLTFFCRLIGMAIFLMTSIEVHATPTCTTVGSSGSVAFTIAVASNFYAPLTSLATTYANSQGYQITLCEDSSGNLYNSIIPSNSPQYAIFFSADTTRPASIVSAGLNYSSPVNYANGTPAFVLSPNAYAASSASYPAAAYLNTALAAGATAISSPGISAISDYVKLKRPPSSSAVTYLAIGATNLAPYGLAAAWILGSDPTGQNTSPGDPPEFTNNMGLWNTSNVQPAGTNVTSSCSSLTSGSQWICSYSNIDYTLQAIANNSVTAGFVSYAQVCPQWAGTTYAAGQYVLFPDYYTTQAYVELNVTSTVAQSYATAFLTYLGVGSSSWNTWLANNCYQSL